MITNHGMIINDRKRAEMILSSVSYYRLSAYGIGLKSQIDKEKYLPGITLEHIYALYRFDSKLRNILMETIEFVEISFRTRLAYHLGIAYGPEGYRDVAHFLDKDDGNGMSIHQKMMARLDLEITHQENLPWVRHHVNVYGGHFPIWAASELFSFGMLCSLYSVLTNRDKKKVSKEFHTDPLHFYGWMMSILELRNMCAHYNRIYNMMFKQQPYLRPEYQQYNGNRLFPKLLVLKDLVAPEIWAAFLKNLHELVSQCPEANVAFMGFPDNWMQVLMVDRS